MNGDIHARFWESAGMRFPRATHLPQLVLEAHERCQDRRRNH